MERVDLEGSLRLPLPAERAFPLFTPLGEVDWVPGWRPTFVHPAGGELAVDQVFRTDVGGEETLWTVVAVDEPASVEYLRVTPGSRFARVTVRVSTEGTESRVDVRYRCTALTPAGAAELETFAAGFPAMLEEWRRLILAFLGRGAGGGPAAGARSPEEG